MTATALFEVMSFDIWKPGDVPMSLRAGKSKTVGVTLTGLDVMTGFAGGGSLESMASAEVARVLFHHFIQFTGLPLLILVNDGSEFKGVIIQVCKEIGIRYWVVTKQNHKAILNERFHRYMNKVQ